MVVIGYHFFINIFKLIAKVIKKTNNLLFIVFFFKTLTSNALTMTILEILLSIPFILLCIYILYKAIETAKYNGYNCAYNNKK